MKKQIQNSFVKYSIEEGEVVIDYLFVDKRQRGNNLGYKLLDFVKSFAKRKEMNMALFAESDDDNFSNDELVEYYEDYGFESDADADQLMTYFL